MSTKRWEDWTPKYIEWEDWNKFFNVFPDSLGLWLCFSLNSERCCFYVPITADSQGERWKRWCYTCRRELVYDLCDKDMDEKGIIVAYSPIMGTNEVKEFIHLWNDDGRNAEKTIYVG